MFIVETQVQVWTLDLSVLLNVANADMGKLQSIKLLNSAHRT